MEVRDRKMRRGEREGRGQRERERKRDRGWVLN